MPDIEKDQLSAWEKNNLFQQSITNRAGNPYFVFYEGPPSANGMPGIHHVISRTLKDLVCRYKTMQGFQVNRKAGWDTHGLPVELGVEKELGITKEDIGVKITVEEYNKKCKEVVMRFKDKWDELTTKMGYWVDLDNPYVTFENDYIETLWWALSKLYEKGYLYKSVSIQPYSPAAGTGLSSHELNQPGTYKDVKDTSATVLFSINEESKLLLFPEVVDNVYLMAWTTTPWTLPSNLGLTVGAKIEYVLVRTYNPYTHQEQYVVLAKALLPKYFKETAAVDDITAVNYTGEKGQELPYTIIKTLTGKELEGARYHQLFQFDSNRPELSGGDPFRVLTGDFVTTEDGTGIVHTAPAHGADDYTVGRKNNIGIINLIDREGKFIPGSGDYAGRFIKNYKDEKDYIDVNVDIAVDLKQKGWAFKVEKYEHSYPHCWRTDKPIVYYPLDAWFIKTTALKDKMVDLNKQINWKPKSTGEGRFGNWLENMVDWNLSRSRYWGTPLPIWISEDQTEKKCIGSIAQLKTEIQKSIDAGFMEAKVPVDELVQDLHRPYIDNIILVSESGHPMRREPDLIDVWFDSGAMPYAQWHFPFENQQTFANNYPADFIAEGVDQTRGWFYTLHALGALLQESVIEELQKAGIEADATKYPGYAYKTVVSNGLVLDKMGNKMSKRVGNVIDPFETINKYSADATRWYLITNASPWDSLRFDTEGIKEIQRKFFGTIYNTYQFFALYANVDGFVYSEATIPISDRHELDQWIISSLNTLIADVTKYMDDYEPTQAGRAIELFVDEHLSNWYVRLSRRRFWKGTFNQDKISAYQTLYECLTTISKLIAPIAPFFADWLFQNLNNVSSKDVLTSVHLNDFPKSVNSKINKSLEERMQLAQDISSLILSIRKKENIRVRQPLSKALVPILEPQTKTQIDKIKEIILSEVNIKEIEYLNPENSFINKKIKPNFKTLGKKVGGLMKELAAIINDLSQEQIGQMEANGFIELDIQDQKVQVSLEDVDIMASDIPGWSVANKGNLTIALDVSISEELLEEGNARELINRLQKIRKDQNLELTDRIQIYLKNTEALNSAIQKFGTYIKEETLADLISTTDNNEHIQHWETIEINEQEILVHIQKSN